MIASLLFAARATAIGGAVATVGLMAWAASWTWSGLGFLVGLMAWGASPYALPALVARRAFRSLAASVAVFATAAVLAVGAAIVYVDVFFFHTDAQGALVFLFVPFWQWVGGLAGIAMASLIEGRGRTPAAPPD